MGPAHYQAVCRKQDGSWRRRWAGAQGWEDRAWGSPARLLGKFWGPLYPPPPLTGRFDFLRGFSGVFTVSPAALRAAILDSMSETWRAADR
jgi:hypothetical protein